MSSTISVRLAVPEDIQDIVFFNKEMAWDTENKALDEQILSKGVANVINGKAEAFYLIAADSNNKAVGSLMITKEWSDWRNAFIWWIQSVYILPEYRRHGIYRRLYLKAKELGETSNCCAFRLYVETNNHVAQTTYSSLGMNKSHYIIFEEMLNGK